VDRALASRAFVSTPSGYAKAVSDDAAKRITGMKKGAMAAVAAQLLAGRNWLPQLLRDAS
jgi:hypothetical protein